MSSATSLLSLPRYNHHFLKHSWEKDGIWFLILLSRPEAWLSHALTLFKAALVTLAWLSNIVAVKIVITTLIGLQVAESYGIMFAFAGLDMDIWREFLGAGENINHRTIIPREGEVGH